MDKINYLELYKTWIASGWLPGDGLCYSLPRHASKELRKIFEPESDDSDCSYWGYNGELNMNHTQRHCRYFSPMRQTIILFMAAMNDQL